MANMAAGPSTSKVSEAENSSGATLVFQCFLCSTPGTFTEEKQHDTMKRSQVLINLWSQIQLNCNAFPEDCPKEKYPLCKNCMTLFQQLWKLQLDKEEINLEIMKTLEKLEGQMLAGEVLSPTDGIEPLAGEVLIVRGMMKSGLQTSNAGERGVRQAREESLARMRAQEMEVSVLEKVKVVRASQPPKGTEVKPTEIEGVAIQEKVITRSFPCHDAKEGAFAHKAKTKGRGVQTKESGEDLVQTPDSMPLQNCNAPPRKVGQKKKRGNSPLPTAKK